MATFHLDGDAFHWYTHLERSRGTPSWEFYVLCNNRFGPPIRSNPLGELRLLRQTGTMADYQSKFLALLSHADPLTERQEQMFTSGLSEDIRIDVELHGSRDLEQAFSLARAYEKKTVRAPGVSRRPFQQPRPPSTAAPTANTTPARAIRQLTPTEMAERRRQGLCFNCDEKFVAATSAPTSSSSSTTTQQPTTRRTTTMSPPTTSRASPYT
jgi:hypothetical protein